MNWIALYQISHLWWWPNHPKLAFESPPKCLRVMNLERSLLLEWKVWQNGLHLKCQTPFLLVLDIWCVIGLVSNWPATCSMRSPWHCHFFDHDLWSLNGASIQRGARVRQLSWFISPITMVYYTYYSYWTSCWFIYTFYITILFITYIVHGLYKPTLTSLGGTQFTGDFMVGFCQPTLGIPFVSSDNRSASRGQPRAVWDDCVRYSKPQRSGIPPAFWDDTHIYIYINMRNLNL